MPAVRQRIERDGIQALLPQQRPLRGGAAGAVLADVPVRLHDAMAGDDVGQRVAGHDRADRTHRTRPSGLTGDPRVRPHLAVRDGHRGAQHGRLVRRPAAQVQRRTGAGLAGDRPSDRTGERLGHRLDPATARPRRVETISSKPPGSPAGSTSVTPSGPHATYSGPMGPSISVQWSVRAAISAQQEAVSQRIAVVHDEAAVAGHEPDAGHAGRDRRDGRRPSSRPPRAPRTPRP